MDISSDFLSSLPLWERVDRRREAAAGRERVRDGGQNDFKNAARILQHSIIPEPQHTKPLTFQPSCATLVGLAIRMLASVDFEDETPFERYEINDVRSDWYLPLDLDSVEPVRAGDTRAAARRRSYWREELWPDGGVPFPSPEAIPLSRLDCVEPPSPARGVGILPSRAAPPNLNHSAAAGVTSVSSTGGGSRFGASFSSAIRASRSRASSASRCRFHILA